MPQGEKRVTKKVDDFFRATFADFRSGTLAHAAELLRADPGLATADIYAASVTGGERRIAALLRRDPALAITPGGPRGWPPLLYLCFSRYLRLRPRSAERFARCARLLLARGADPNAFWMQGDTRETALYGASGIANCAPVTRELLAAGADPEGADRETLYHTAEHHDHSCLELVLARTRPGSWSSYCMAHKLDMEDPAGLQLFLDHGADPNYLGEGNNAMRGIRPLHFAILRHRGAATLRVLLRGGADPNLADARGMTPLALARRFGHRAAVRVLRAAGAADPAGPPDAHAEGIDAVMSGSAPAARRAIPDPAAFLHALTGEDRALLPHAAAAGNLAAVRLMLDLGWDIETPGPWQGTALHQAIYHGHRDVVELLLARGARTAHRNAFGGDALGTAVHAALDRHRPASLAIVRLLAARLRRPPLARHLRAAHEAGDTRLARLLEKLAAR